MRKALLSVALTSALCASTIATPAAGEATQDVNGEILQQFVAANQSLEQLVRAVRRLAEQQKADVLVRRLDIEERAILELRPELARVREERDKAGREVEHMRTTLERTDNLFIIEQAERAVPGAEARLADLERRMQELQADFDQRRREAAKLKGMLDEGS